MHWNDRRGSGVCMVGIVVPNTVLYTTIEQSLNDLNQWKEVLMIYFSNETTV